MRYLLLFLLLNLFSAISLSAEAEYRIFESTDGATIEATVVEASAVSVTIERKDGREFKDVPLDRFSVQIVNTSESGETRKRKPYSMLILSLIHVLKLQY